MKFSFTFCTLMLLIVSFSDVRSQPRKFNVIAYYSGGPEKVDSIAAGKLTHIIYSFCHLKGNKLVADDKRDSLTITKLVGLKAKNSSLKVILSLGGWGGCPSCSDVFSTSKGRKEFSRSVLSLNRYFKSDGIDLDWEYPTIEGYPGHKFTPKDKENFTALIKTLRKTLGKNYEISFAAGGFKKFLEESVEWKPVMKKIDRVNLMTYDLVNGYSPVTGHHTPLFSTSEQTESTDNAVKYLISIGIPADKIVLGAAFYGRMWENVPASNNGLYQQGKFKTSRPFKRFASELSEENGFAHYWDDVAKAPYAYNESKQLFITFDNKVSIEYKTNYVIENRLDGIMFWELTEDINADGLLDVIHRVKMNMPLSTE